MEITGRQVRSQGATAPKETPLTKSFSLSSSRPSTRESVSALPTYQDDRRKSKFGIKFPVRLSGISKPIAADPDQFSKWESRSSPVAHTVQRPPTALHPAYGSAIRYSEAHHLDRF